MALEFWDGPGGEAILFAGVPKSGCRFTREMLRCRYMMDKSAVTGQHVPEHREGMLLFSNVRNPIDWIRSYFQNIGNKIDYEPVDAWQELRKRALAESGEQPNDRSLTKFVELYLEGPPGAIQRTFESYKADVVWRIEDLPRAAERHFGQPFAYPDRRATRHQFFMDVRLQALIREHEKVFVDKWSY